MVMLWFRRRENDSCKQKGQENTFLGWNAKYSPYFIIYSSTTDRRSTDEIVCHISSHFYFEKPMTLRNYTNKQISYYICIYTSISVDLAMDITDPSSMQNACHMNFVIHLAHRKVSVVEHRSAESEGLRLDSL